MKTGMNSNIAKSQNRGLVLKLLSCGQVSSRIEITKRIHLSKMAVTNIVAQLIEDGYLIQTDIAENNNVGRNPIGLGISSHAPQVLGLYLSRERAEVALSDLRCQLLFSEEVTLENETAASLTEKLITLLEQAQLHATSRILGIGIAAIGPLDCDTGILLNPANFFGIVDFPIKQCLENHFNLPVFINNDMNAAAQAECLYGVDPLQNFIYLGMTNGIGSGIISHGRLYQNSSGFAGEIGHMGVDLHGEYCSCGNRGCLELYINMPVICNRLKVASGNPHLRYTDFESVMERPACAAVMTDVIEKLAYALINAANLLNPEGIVLGHDSVYLPNKYICELEGMLNRGILSAGHQTIRVRKSSFGVKAPLVGSVCQVLEQLFSGALY